MNVPLDRELITQVIVVLGICIGGWMMYVRPKMEEFNTVNAAVQKSQTRATALPPAVKPPAVQPPSTGQLNQSKLQ